MDFLVIPLIVVLGLNNGNAYATTMAAQAYIKQSGIEEAVHKWQERELSPMVRARIGEITYIAKVIQTKSIFHRWEF